MRSIDATAATIIFGKLEPAYQFTAIDASGKQQKGVLEGDSARQIRQQLRDKAWTPISVDPVEQKDKHQSHGLFQKSLVLTI